MKRLLPGRTEVAILATLAIICALIVATMEVKDLGLAMLTIPVFVTAGLMGMRRHPLLGSIQPKVEPKAEELVEQSS
jgi:hypothetical protein